MEYNVIVHVNRLIMYISAKTSLSMYALHLSNIWSIGYRTGFNGFRVLYIYTYIN